MQKLITLLLIMIINLSLKAQQVCLTFKVQVPAQTPAHDTIYLVGNHPKLGNWSAKGLACERIGPQQYRLVLYLPKGTHLEYKINRGSWDTVEKDARGYERPNRVLLVKKRRTIPVKVLRWADQAQAPIEHTWVGTIKSHPQFRSRYLKYQRDIWVYLPPNYEHCRDQHYPVLYVHDGNNVFDRATAFLGVEWELDNTAQRLITKGKIRPIIIVAIANTPARVAEYTPVQMPGEGGGQADQYAQFLIQELKPFIDKTYRTLPSARHTAIMGSSLGGLVSLYIAWQYPQVFGMTAAVSPSLWWAHGYILDHIARTPVKPALKIWLDMGTAEDRQGKGPSPAILALRKLKKILLAKGFRLRRDLAYLEVKGGRHNEADWARRVDKILCFFFGRPKCRLLRKLWRRR